jgi:hypothetical protein
MFASKAKSSTKRGETERGSTWVGSGLAHKHYSRLERLARDKHSSLLRKSVHYGGKKFYSTGPRMALMVKIMILIISAPVIPGLGQGK